MMKISLSSLVLIVVLAFTLSVSAQEVAEMKFLFAYQGPANVACKDKISPLGDQFSFFCGTRKTFRDLDKNNLISGAVFLDADGDLHNEQIDDTTYAYITMTEGQLFNPKKIDPKASIFSLFKPKKAYAAIAFDAVSSAFDGSGAITSITFSHTVTGTETFLGVTAASNQSPGGTVTHTTATYNGVAMTHMGTGIAIGSDRVSVAGYYLIDPDTGTHNVVVNISGTGPTLYAKALSYTGADQVSQPDSFATSSLNASNPATFTVTSTVVDADSWLIGGASENAGCIAGGAEGANTTYRGNAINNMEAGDSNGATGAGSKSLIFGRQGACGTADIAGIVFSIDEYEEAAPPGDITATSSTTTAEVIALNNITFGLALIFFLLSLFTFAYFTPGYTKR